MPTPILFLDLDDVLCVHDDYNSYQVMMAFRGKNLEWPELWQHLVNDGARNNLRVLIERFGLQVVVSSSWATYLSREQMTEVFARTGLEFVTVALHAEWATPRARSSDRRMEIEWWLEAHPETSIFLALDDTASGWSLAHSPIALEGHVVLCAPGEGFTGKMLHEAQRLLQRQVDALERG